MRWLPLARRCAAARGAEAEHLLAEAYRTVFSTRSPEARIVLADLADFTGFYRVNGQGVPPDDRAFTDGMRAAFGRLFRFLNLTDEERAALIDAARAETLASAAHGSL